MHGPNKISFNFGLTINFMFIKIKFISLIYNSKYLKDMRKIITSLIYVTFFVSIYVT